MDILLDVYIDVKPQEVFEAISEPDLLMNWWPLTCDGKPELGAEYNFFFENPYDWYGKVSEIKRNEAFYIRMTKSDEDWDTTTFGFELRARNEGTLVQFSHRNWLKNNHHFRHSAYCWAILLKGLKNYLEKGVIVPFNDRS